MFKTNPAKSLTSKLKSNSIWGMLLIAGLFCFLIGNRTQGQGVQSPNRLDSSMKADGGDQDPTETTFAKPNVETVGLVETVQNDNSDSGGSTDSHQPVAPIQFSGVLTKDDEQLKSGEFFDSYTFTVETPARIVVEMRGEFDTYLILSGPDGYNLENDNALDGKATGSLIETDVVSPGIYTAYATASRSGVTGQYGVRLEVREQKANTNESSGSNVNQRWKMIDVEQLEVSVEIPSDWKFRFDKNVMTSGALMALSPPKGGDALNFRENIVLGYEAPKPGATGIPSVRQLFEAGKKHLLRSGGAISNVGEVTLGGKHCIRHIVELEIDGDLVKTHQLTFVTPDKRGWTAALYVHPDAEDSSIIDDVKALVHMVTTLKPTGASGPLRLRQANLVFNVPSGWAHHVDQGIGQARLYGPGNDAVVFGVGLDRSGQGLSLDTFLEAANDSRRLAGMPDCSSERMIRLAGRRAHQATIEVPYGDRTARQRLVTFMTSKGAACIHFTTFSEPDDVIVDVWEDFLQSLAAD